MGGNLTAAGQLRRKIRWLLGLFLVGLLASGITAFPLLHELNVLASLLGLSDASSPDPYRGLAHWILKVREGLQVTYSKYPFMAYGTDWLAFGHFVIALFFIGPIIDPVRNIWAIRAGLVACVAVIPLALICGALREIPLCWRLVDCSFGVIGFIPLWWALRLTRRLEEQGGE